jgi:hypothetical protein
MPEAGNGVEGARRGGSAHLPEDLLAVDHTANGSEIGVPAVHQAWEERMPTAIIKSTML